MRDRGRWYMGCYETSPPIPISSSTYHSLLPIFPRKNRVEKVLMDKGMKVKI